jgi:hypothetical protein
MNLNFIEPNPSKEIYGLPFYPSILHDILGGNKLMSNIHAIEKFNISRET